MNSLLIPLDTHRRPQEPPAGLALVAIPHAGGTAHAFRGWTAPSRTRGLRAFGVRTEAPGVGSPDWTVRARARRLAESMAGIREPYVLVGHSLGGVIAAEAVLHLQQHIPEAIPALLVICATNPPHVQLPIPTPNGTEAEAVDFLRAVGGTPAEVLDDPHMRELAVAMLLNDLDSLRDYAWDGRRLTIPTAVYAGRTDRFAPPESLARWTEVAEAVTTRVFDSGHFFPHDRTAEVLDAIRLDLAGPSANRTTGHPHVSHRP